MLHINNIPYGRKILYPSERINQKPSQENCGGGVEEKCFHWSLMGQVNFFAELTRSVKPDYLV